MDFWSLYGNVRLREPIEIDGELIAELKFREPTPNDLEKIGVPFIVKGETLQFDGAKMSEMIAKLAGVEMGVVRRMRARDWSQSAWVLAQYLHARSLDEIVLDAYRLGKYYSTDPTVFLSKPISEIQRMIGWTNKLIERARIEGSAED
jgi:hypothetical protein